jgi:CrcB protein
LADPGSPAPDRGRGALPRIDRRELAAIFAGGAIGTLLRAGLGALWPDTAGAWPWTTFAVNVAGAFALGYFATRLQERLPLSSYRRPLLGTGFCGGLTTFSTLQVQLVQLLDADRYGVAGAYVAGSLAAGYAGVMLATAMVRRTRVVA